MLNITNMVSDKTLKASDTVCKILCYFKIYKTYRKNVYILIISAVKVSTLKLAAIFYAFFNELNYLFSSSNFTLIKSEHKAVMCVNI